MKLKDEKKMLKVVVFSGGTGSIALQNGISRVYGTGNLKLDIVVNAYDNGKSTGVCRRVFHNRILGPSDVRKNQLLQFSIQHRKEMEDKNSRYFRLYDLFEIRPSANSPMEYYNLARKLIETYSDILNLNTKKYLCQLIEFFFFDPEDESKMRSTVEGEVFEDFSLSNIFYASCAAMHGYSLEKAADYMAELLEISNNVHLISDISLTLQAETQSEKIIEDEGDIVTWDNPDDKIVRAILLYQGKEYIPSINENSVNEYHSIKKLVQAADLIIFSSGTQWSSLIPTYMHAGFKELIHSSKAKKYLVMNNAEDHDSFGVGAEEFCDILNQYINMDEITVVLNDCAVQPMRNVSEKYRSISGKLSELNSRQHIPEALILRIMEDYYQKQLKCKKVFWDLDETLWYERGNDADKVVGRENLALFDGIILSGNSVSHIRKVFENNAPKKSVEVYADYGNSCFMTDSPEQISCLSDEFNLSDSLFDEINQVKGIEGKASIRGNTIITIKPLENREHWVDVIRKQIKADEKNLSVCVAGKTSVDVKHAIYSKATALKMILEKKNILSTDVLFVGNELLQGSEIEIAKMDITTLQVNDVYECNVFLKTMNAKKEKLPK